MSVADDDNYSITEMKHLRGFYKPGNLQSRVGQMRGTFTDGVFGSTIGGSGSSSDMRDSSLSELCMGGYTTVGQANIPIGHELAVMKGRACSAPPTGKLANILRHS